MKIIFNNILKRYPKKIIYDKFILINNLIKEKIIDDNFCKCITHNKSNDEIVIKSVNLRQSSSYKNLKCYINDEFGMEMKSSPNIVKLSKKKRSLTLISSNPGVYTKKYHIAYNEMFNKYNKCYIRLETPHTMISKDVIIKYTLKCEKSKYLEISSSCGKSKYLEISSSVGHSWICDCEKCGDHKKDKRIAWHIIDHLQYNYKREKNKWILLYCSTRHNSLIYILPNEIINVIISFL